MVFREEQEKREYDILSEYACKSAESRGRAVYEEPCELRTEFQRDRDRIIHSKALRRLMHKTQVFLSPEGDHFRTRLTHTLEVAQIARTISRALGLNEDLTEAIALGHDLGHTPFGHNGEAFLNEIHPGGFAHNVQSLRVVDVIERNANGRTMNLTAEVRDGIVNHTGPAWPFTLEGQVVRHSDRIAYINHDIDDAATAGVMREEEIPAQIRAVLGESKSARINTLVLDCIQSSGADICLSAEVQDAFDALHTFMFEKVYTNPVCKSEEIKAAALIQKLFDYYTEVPERLPPLYREIALCDGLEAAACDFIAGMTDRYAVRVFNDIFVPKAWSRQDEMLLR